MTDSDLIQRRYRIVYRLNDGRVHRGSPRTWVNMLFQLKYALHCSRTVPTAMIPLRVIDHMPPQSPQLQEGSPLDVSHS